MGSLLWPMQYSNATTVGRLALRSGKEVGLLPVAEHLERSSSTRPHTCTLWIWKRCHSSLISEHAHFCRGRPFRSLAHFSFSLCHFRISSRSVAQKVHSPSTWRSVHCPRNLLWNVHPMFDLLDAAGSGFPRTARVPLLNVMNPRRCIE